MLKVKYEQYWNDHHRKTEEKSFSSLSELEEWMFGQMQRDYTKPHAMSFPVPEAVERIHADGPWAAEFQPACGSETFWVRYIEDETGIIFSDGTFTAGQKHWSGQAKSWLEHCESRRKAPKFNFAD